MKHRGAILFLAITLTFTSSGVPVYALDLNSTEMPIEVIADKESNDERESNTVLEEESGNSVKSESEIENKTEFTNEEVETTDEDAIIEQEKSNLEEDKNCLDRMEVSTTNQLLMMPRGVTSNEYSPEDAVSYALSHYKDGKGNSAEFVTACLHAGGLTSFSGGLTAKMCEPDQGNLQKYGFTKRALLYGNYGSSLSLRNSLRNAGKVSVGDVLVYKCDNCSYNSGETVWAHIAIVSKVDSYGDIYIADHNGLCQNSYWEGYANAAVYSHISGHGYPQKNLSVECYHYTGSQSVTEENIYTGSCGDNVFFNFDTDTGTLVISGSGKMRDFEYQFLDGAYYGVELPWDYFKWRIKKVDIQQGITSIGKYAFSGCSSLVSVNIPSGVTSIGDAAFETCEKLSSVNMPSGVTSIGNLAFSQCRNLSSANIPLGVTSIGNAAFQLCTNLTNINVPASVTYIGSNAFSGCKSSFYIIGNKGSYAETYAIEQNIDFVLKAYSFSCFSMSSSVIDPIDLSLSVPIGTTLNDLRKQLPVSAYATFSQDNTVFFVPVSINWTTENYNANKIGNYSFLGTPSYTSENDKKQYMNIGVNLSLNVKVTSAEMTIEKKLEEFSKMEGLRDGEYADNCYEFVNKLVYKNQYAKEGEANGIFGHSFAYSSEYYYLFGKASIDSQNELKKLLMQCKSGDVLCWNTELIDFPSGETAKNAHYAVFLSADEQGIKVYEGNYGSRIRYNGSYSYGQLKTYIYAPVQGLYVFRSKAINQNQDKADMTGVCGVGSNFGWSSMTAEIGKRPNSSYTIIMNNETTIPKVALEEAKESKCDLVLNFQNYSWSIKADDIDTAESINLEVNKVNNYIPSGILSELQNPVVQIKLTHSGVFGFNATLRYYVGKIYSGKKVSLYYYDENDMFNKLAKTQTVQVDKNGYADFKFSHASYYVINLDDGESGGNASSEPSNSSETPSQTSNYSNDTNKPNKTYDTETQPYQDSNSMRDTAQVKHQSNENSKVVLPKDKEGIINPKKSKENMEGSINEVATNNEEYSTITENDNNNETQNNANKSDGKKMASIIIVVVLLGGVGCWFYRRKKCEEK